MNTLTLASNTIDRDGNIVGFDQTKIKTTRLSSLAVKYHYDGLAITLLSYSSGSRINLDANRTLNPQEAENYQQLLGYVLNLAKNENN